MTKLYDQLPDLDTVSSAFNLNNRTGLITGGCGKMSQAMARFLVKAGARIILSDLNKSAAKIAATAINDELKTSAVTALPADVSDPKSVSKLFQKIDRLDFFIHNVLAKPENYYQSFEDYDVKTWQAVMDGNLTGAFLCCQKAQRLLKKNPSSSIVLTSSVYGLVAPDFRIYERTKKSKNIYAGKYPLTLPAPYAASKGGLIALTKYLASKFSRDGIRVNSLIPGGVYDKHPADFHEAYVQKTLSGRMAVFSDFNGPILFLLADASRYMTGTNLIVDGGWTAW